MFKSLAIASCIVGSFALMPAASAHDGRPNEGAALELFSLGLGAAIAASQQQAGPPACNDGYGSQYPARWDGAAWRCAED